MLCAALELVGASVVAIFLHPGCQDVVRSCAPCFPCQVILTGSHCLPPRFRLNPIREPAGSVLEWNSANQTTEPVRPIRISQKHPQHRPAEELAARADLRRNSEFAEPAVELSSAVLRRDKTFRVVESTLKCQGNVLSEKHFGSQSERGPVIKPMAMLAVPLPLKDENRHDGESVVGLNQQMFRDQQSFGTLQERSRILDRSAEISCCTLPVLDGERVVAPVPFQALVAYPERVAVGGRNHRAGLRSAAFGRRKIKPSAPPPEGAFEIVDTDVDIAFRVVPVLRHDIGPRARQIGHGQLADAEIPVLDTRSVTAHVQRIEVINFNMLAAVIALTGPEFRVRLEIQNVAGADKGFP